MTHAGVTEVDTGPHTITRRVTVGAPAAELFELVAHPRQHHDLDGSGTVGATIEGPDRLSADARFTTHMKQFGVGYTITSHVTEFAEGRIIQWQHPMGHRWRWQFDAEAGDSTVITETWDYSTVNAAKRLMFHVIRQPSKNLVGIENTLANLRARYR